MCCSHSKRFCRQWKAFDVLIIMRYILGGGAAGGLWCHQQWSPFWPPSWILPRIRKFFFLGGGGGFNPPQSHTNETYLCTRRLKLKRRRRSITWRFSVMLRCSQQHKSPSIYLFFSILCVIFFNRLKLVRSDGRGNYRLKVNSNRHRKGHQAPQKYESWHHSTWSALVLLVIEL